jgi:hypothetical protein
MTTRPASDSTPPCPGNSPGPGSDFVRAQPSSFFEPKPTYATNCATNVGTGATSHLFTSLGPFIVGSGHGSEADYA